MPRTDFKYTRVRADPKKYGEMKGSFNSLSKEEFNQFNPSILGLGDIAKEGTYTQALAAFLDLQGFTSFCNQVDSHLVVPVFLTQYLPWLFDALVDEFKEGENEERVTIWGSLPFFSKFLGDGILLLWDTSFSRGAAGIRNIVGNLHSITVKYSSMFFPIIRRRVSKPPVVLRCGIARGQIISVGDNNDYVGSCINVASRLQKLSNLTFGVSIRGIELPESAPKESLWSDLFTKEVALRGIGNEELVYIKRSEFEKLTETEKNLFKDP